MSRRAKNARKVAVYSCQRHNYPDGDPGALLDHLTVADAAAEVDAGNAKWLRGGVAIQLLALARAERMPLPSTITASEMLAAAGGQRNARRKVDAWGQLQEAFLRSLVATA